MEYVIVIAVGALFAGLLYMTMSDGEGLIQSALEKKVLEIIQGQLSEGDVSSGNTSGLNGSPDLDNASGLDPFAGNPETGGFPDAGIPPEMGGAFDRSGTTPGVLPVESRIQPFPGDGSVRPVSEGDPSASTASGEDGWFSGWWNKAKNYVTSGQILKDAAHIGKETLDFLILDDVSGCFTGKDTDGNQLAGWERGLSCVSLVPAAKWVKLGKYADEALTFAGKLDDKLARTRLGEGIQTAKRKLEDRFSRGKETACGCNDFLTPKGKSKLVKFKNQMLLEQHFDKHAKKIMKAMGKNQYTIKEYLEDANHVIRNGQYVPELNAYVKLIGGKGKAKYAFVGMDRKTGNITTFHIKSAKELSKEAPSLGIEYK